MLNIRKQNVSTLQAVNEVTLRVNYFSSSCKNVPQITECQIFCRFQNVLPGRFTSRCHARSQSKLECRFYTNSAVHNSSVAFNPWL